MTVWYEEYLQAWDELDIDKVLGWFTDDVVYEDTTLGHTSTGTKELRGFVQASFKNVPNAKFDFIGGRCDETSYAYEWVMQPMGIRGVSIGTLRDGKIADNRDYWDGAKFAVPNA